MERLRIGLNLVWLVEGAAGIGRYATELLPALLEAEPANQIVAFVSRDAPKDLLAAPWAANVRWHTLPVGLEGAPVHLAAQFAGLPVLARRGGLDVIHSPANVGPAIAPGVATVVTVHDLLWLHQAQHWEGRRAQRSLRALQRHSARRASRVIAISQAVRRDVIANLGVEERRVDVVHQGVSDRAWTDPVPESDLRRRLELGSSRVVLCVAQKRPYKNLASLIRAVSELRDRDVCVVLPGAPTAHEAELRELADRLGVHERVRFPAWVSDAELEGLYALAHCFVLPSFMEGFGLPVLEAMQRDVPVACSERWALPEVAGDAALLFDPADQAAVTGAVRRLLDDGDLGRELVRRGRLRCRQFAWRRTAELTLAAYRRARDGIRRSPNGPRDR
jgi:glycosyltransferase involved in cell wall biosynthesis